jgi:hypothetical protein
MSTRALRAAIYYAAGGFAVFPCWPRRKEPATPRGFYNATTNPATIRRWWLANPDYNVALASGIASGVWILDVDGDGGARSLITAWIGLVMASMFEATPATCWHHHLSTRMARSTAGPTTGRRPSLPTG